MTKTCFQQVPIGVVFLDTCHFNLCFSRLKESDASESKGGTCKLQAFEDGFEPKRNGKEPSGTK